MSTTIIALSDTHEASLQRLPEALRAALERADVIVHAGDITEMTLLQELRAIKDTIAVAGNMDSTAVKIALPERHLFTLAGKSVGVVHGSGAPSGIDERVRRLFPENPDLIIFGHSHVPYNGELQGSHMVNPGPGRKSYATITVLRDRIETAIVPL